MRWIGGWIAGDPQPKISGDPNRDRPGSTKEEAAMHTSELRHPSPGTVMGFLALLISFAALAVALSGSADAALHVYIVKKGDIAPGAVTAKTLAHGAVHPKALAKGAVTAPKIKAGAVDTAALAKGAVTAAALG